MVLDWPRPTDLDAQGNPIPINGQQRRTFNDEVAEYDRLDNIAFSDLMKACRQNLKVKNLSETGKLNTALKNDYVSVITQQIILQRQSICRITMP